MNKNYTIICFAQNTPGVLYRIANLFLKRKINIESLTVSDTQTHDISRFTIVVNVDQATIEKITKQLYRIIEVVKVFEKTDKDLVFKELSFFKVSTRTPQKRKQVEELCYLYNAKVIYVGSTFLVVEKSGSEEQINSLLLLLKPFGLKEFVRSGRIAVLKEDYGSGTQVNSKLPLKNSSIITTAIDVSAIKKIELLGQQTPGVISLAQGVPSFTTPDFIKDAAIKAIQDNLAGKYTSGYGIPQLQDAICKKVQTENGIPAKRENIIVTHGAIEALMSIFLSLFDPQDEILVPTPDYASHITQIIIARHGGKPVFVPLHASGQTWELDPDKLESAITPSTKGILLCNPSNPTGKVYSRQELAHIARIALKYNLYIIADEIYEYFTYDKHQHISIGSLPQVADRVITVLGVSKSYAMTGWRIGYIVADSEVVKQIFKIHDSLITCPAAVSQYAALAAITAGKKSVKHFQDEFHRRRDLVINAIATTPKLSLIVPQGTYYAFPKITVPVDDYELTIRLVNEAKVAVVPGSAFGLGGQNHLRISFGCEEKQLTEGLSRLIKFLNTHL